LENQNILEAPILTPKQPQIVDYPPFDSEMLFSTPKYLEKNKKNRQNRELNDQNSEFQLKFEPQ